MSAVNAGILASLLSALLFFLSFWTAKAVPDASPSRRHAAAAGALILAATALYAADIVNLPEIFAALIIGGAGGLLLGREAPAPTLPMLMTALAGMVGLAAVAVALAAWLNPYAFGLMEEARDHMAAGKAVALGLILLCGGIACGGAIVAIAARRLRSGSLVLFFATAAMAGWSVAAMAFLLENIGLAVAAGLAGSAGTMFAARLCADASGKGLADAPRRP